MPAAHRISTCLTDSFAVVWHVWREVLFAKRRGRKKGWLDYFPQPQLGPPVHTAALIRLKRHSFMMVDIRRLQRPALGLRLLPVTSFAETRRLHTAIAEVHQRGTLCVGVGRTPPGGLDRSECRPEYLVTTELCPVVAERGFEPLTFGLWAQ